MIDPFNITDYDMDRPRLEEFLLFWVCAAGKKATTVSKSLDNFLETTRGTSPFDKIKSVGLTNLPNILKKHGIGCYTSKARSMWELANSDMDLKSCTADDLENIHGIGMKTSRCFLIHSRKDVQNAGLDTHVLKFLKSKGHDVPKSTPGSKKKYKELEQLFLKYANESGKPVAEFDLDIWRSYAKRT